MKTPAALAIALLLQIALPAQGAVSNKADDGVRLGAYVVDPQRTRVGFTVAHIGFSSYSGHFSDASGGLELGSAANAKLKSSLGSSVHISVPVGSVSTDNEMLDDELKSADWLDSKQFPIMTFTSTRVTTDGSLAKVVGELTLHGVTNPVTFDVRFVGAGVAPPGNTYTAEFEISGDIKRSAFGVTGFIPVVSDDVHLSIDAAFDRQ